MLRIELGFVESKPRDLGHDRGYRVASGNDSGVERGEKAFVILLGWRRRKNYF